MLDIFSARQTSRASSVHVQQRICIAHGGDAPGGQLEVREPEEADGDSKICLILQYKELQESGLWLPFLVTRGLRNLFFLVSKSISHSQQGPVLDCHPSPKAILPLFYTSGNWADYKHLLAVGGNGIEFCPMQCE